MHFKTFISKIHFKAPPSKNAFQNWYLSSIVIEGTKTVLFFFTNFKEKINTNPTLNKPKTF